MSIVGNSQLNKVINEQGISNAAEILNALNAGLTEWLNQRKGASIVRDGMDISLCVFDKKTKMLQFSGAFNPLYLVRNKNLQVTKGDKFPIGMFVGEKLEKFTNHEIQLESGDTIYLFSDGYADQFGGPKGKKFKYRRFQELLVGMNDLSMSEQKIKLGAVLREWQEDIEQVDDILVMGVKVE